MKNKAQFTSQAVDYATPKWLYDELNKEFSFDDDPCPFDDTARVLYGCDDGLARPWGNCVFINPPYGRLRIAPWVKRAYEESLRGKTIVMLIPSRTDTKWWHKYVMKASEIRFVKGRLKFNESKQGAPFPSAVVVFRDTVIE